MFARDMDNESFGTQHVYGKREISLFHSEPMIFQERQTGYLINSQCFADAIFIIL